MPSWNKGTSRVMDWLRAHADHAGNDCLMWPFARDPHGYGSMGINGKTAKPHRVMCEWHRGPAPTPKHHAAHSCGRGQEGCVNPHHLSWKTPKENMADSVRLGVAGHKQGAIACKLTPEQVAEIRILCETMSYSEIAAKFGVKPKQIGRIKRRENWKAPTDRRAFTSAEIEAITAAKGDRTQRDLAAEYRTNIHVIARVQKGKRRPVDLPFRGSDQ